MTPRRLPLLVAWLVLALAWGQQAALLHALGHASERLAAHEDSGPLPAKCADHSLFSSLSSALGAQAPQVAAVAPAGVAPEAQRPRSAWTELRLSFLSRAPPASPV